MTPPALKVVGEGKTLGDEDLRRWLESHIKNHEHLTTAELSRSDNIGVSSLTLEAYLNGTYFLSRELGGMGEDAEETTLEERVRSYRDWVERNVKPGYGNTFIETRSWHQFQHACNVAITEKVIVIVYAKPGTGKSRCLKQYANEKLKTRPVEVLCSPSTTTSYFVQKVARSLGITSTGSTPRIEDLIVKKLKTNPRPIFVDQANYLREKALGSICYFWETARIPIVLIGTHDLAEVFNTSSLTEDVRAQLTSRIAMHYPLMELSIQELKTIVTRVLGARATPDVIERIFNATEGNHRHLDMILPRLSEMIEKNQPALDKGALHITDLVHRASSRLMVG